MLRAFLVVLITALSLFATPLLAQDEVSINYGEWEAAAAQAEKLSNNNEATNDDLAATRSELVQWRESFKSAQNLNGGEIKSVKEQIDSLGAAPKEGEAEPDDIASRRAELEKELSKLEAPRIKADEAFSHADSLIKEIDEVSAERQAIALATLSPSPLLPSSWVAALADGAELLKGVAAEAHKRTSDASIWDRMRPNLPRVVGYLVAALLLLTVGRFWVGHLPSRLSAHASEYSRAVVAFAVSLAQIALPVVGLYLLVSAVNVSGLPGEWTAPIWDAVPVAGLIFFSGLWISRQLFPNKAVAYDTLIMTEPARNSARRMTNSLSMLFSLHYLISTAALPLSGIYERVGDETNRVPLEFSAGAVSVYHAIMIVLTGLALFRLANVLRRINRSEDEPLPGNRYRILAFMGGVSRFVVLGVFLLTALGFINLANGFLWPWLLTLAMFALLILLKDFSADLFSMIKRGEEGARDGLTPMLIGFGLIILSIPVFLLIWGARGTDLAEIWSNFRQGVTFGGITLSPGSITTLLIVFALGYMATRGVQGMFRNTILPKTKLDQGGKTAVISGLGYVGIFLAGLMAINAAGINMSSLAIVAGALSVGIGFGLQNIVSNFVSGIILLIERPVSVGDWISAGGQQGIVKRISVRSTQVETFDKTEVIVPNSDLISQPVTNWTRQNALGRIIVPVQVAYGTDTRRVEAILQAIIEDQPLVTIDPAPFVLFSGFGASGLDFEVRAVLSDVGAGIVVASDVRHEIARRFAEENIEMPFPQSDIWIRNPEALRGPSAKASPEDITPEDITPADQKISSHPGPRMIPDETAGYDNGDGDGDGGGDGDGR